MVKGVSYRTAVIKWKKTFNPDRTPSRCRRSRPHERYRPVVLERHDHHFAETSSLHFDDGRGQFLDDPLEQQPGPLRLLGVVEAGTASTSDRTGQRELRTRQDGTAGLGDVAVHLAGVIPADTQLADLLRRIAHDLLRVPLLDRGEDEHAGSDLRHEL